MEKVSPASHIHIINLLFLSIFYAVLTISRGPWRLHKSSQMIFERVINRRLNNLIVFSSSAVSCDKVLKGALNTIAQFKRSSYH